MYAYIEYNIIKKIKLTNINCYFILEEDFFIAQEVQTCILKYYQKKNFLHIIKIIIQSHDTWNKVYHEYQQRDFFFQKKILLIIFNKNNIHHNLQYILHQIQKYNNKNIILIIRCNNTHHVNNIITLKKIIQSNQIIIYCPYLTIHCTKQWIKKKIHVMNFCLKSKIIDLLSYHYERNLLMLFKILEILQIINTNTNITTKYIQEIIVDQVSFSIKHWIYALFSKNHIQAVRMLTFFQKVKYNISQLIRALQNNLIHLIHLKEYNIYTKYLNNNKKNIIFYDKTLNLQIIFHNMNYNKIYNIINILTTLEINNKNCKHELLWEYIKKIIFIF
ncbi:DNA polymerase III subunit delta [Buchnera aphidicola (Takecallis taiwana)]|uniref:hypothetical protein n=1 Tax=Buchnera aphidicola TaxID=9 RepID=UPI0031B6725F